MKKIQNLMAMLITTLIAVFMVNVGLPMKASAVGIGTPYTSTIVFCGEKNVYIDSTYPYLVIDDGNIEHYTAEPTNWCAYIDSENGILILKNYDGPKFYTVSESGDLTIKLVGTNTITALGTNEQQYGIRKNAGSGELKITSDEAATLTINVETTGDKPAVGIDLNRSGWQNCSFTLGGKAHLIVNAKAEYVSSYEGAVGINAVNSPVSIEDNASYTANIVNLVNCSASNKARCGISAGTKTVTVNTTGDIYIDCSQSLDADDKSIGIACTEFMVIKAHNITVKTTPNSFSTIAGGDDYWPHSDNIDLEAYWVEKIVSATDKTYRVYGRIPGSQYRVFRNEPENLTVAVGENAYANMELEEDLIANDGYLNVYLEEKSGDVWNVYYQSSLSGYGGTVTIGESDTEVTKTYRWCVKTTTAGKQYSNEFTVTWIENDFTIQPIGGTGNAGNEFTITFDTVSHNYDILLEKYNSETDSWDCQDRMLMGTTHYYVPYGTMGGTDRYRLNMQNGGGTGVNVYSNEFEITWDANIFKTQPTGGTCELNQGYQVIYTVNDYVIGEKVTLQIKNGDSWDKVKDITSLYVIYNDATEHTENYRLMCTYKDRAFYSDEFTVVWKHSHKYNETWSGDYLGHWHAATCGHYVMGDFDMHTPKTTASGAIVCTECGYVITSMTDVAKNNLVNPMDMMEVGTVLEINEELIATDEGILNGYLNGKVTWVYTSASGELCLYRDDVYYWQFEVTEEALGGSVHCVVYNDDYNVAWISPEISLVETVGVALSGYSLSLTDQIGVNFYMKLSNRAAADAGAYMEFDLPNNEKQMVSVKDAVKCTIDGKQYYVFSCAVAPKQMTDTITAVLKMSDGTCSDAYSFTVEDYIKYIYDNSSEYDIETLELVKAINLYGYNAQKYFGYNIDRLVDISRADSLSNNMLETLGISVDSFDMDAAGEKLEAMGIGLIGNSLVLDSQVKIRMYFQMADAVAADFNSGVNTIKDVATGASYVLTKVIDGVYYIESSPIIADEGMKSMSITVSVGDKSETIKYSAYQYCESALGNATGNTSLKDLINAYVCYSYAAGMLTK